MTPAALAELIALAGLPQSAAGAVTISAGDPVFPTRYRIAATGAAAIGAVGLAAAELWRLRTGRGQRVSVDARAAAAALRSFRYLRVDGAPPPPDAGVTGFYPLRDGRWIYLHCHFSNLRDRNLAVLGVREDAEDIARATRRWDGPALEAAIFAGGGVGSLVRDAAEWDALPQAQAVAPMAAFEIERIGDAPPEALPPGPRPLSGVRVLDLTRVLAGPTSTRALAEHGADVLRVGREGLPDSGLVDFDTGLGKLSTWLDLREPNAMDALRALVRTGDVFVQSYRPGTLAARGLSPEALAALRPGIVYATLSAWGHEGPWRERRGFDTVVQAANGMAHGGAGGKPELLPVSAQDYVAGYLMAFGTMVALHRRAVEGGSWRVRVCLAAVGQWIRRQGLLDAEAYAGIDRELPQAELASLTTDSASPIGRLTHLAPVVRMSETPARWSRPAVPLGSSPPQWPERG